jgi:hypothetical protein
MWVKCLFFRKLEIWLLAAGKFPVQRVCSPRTRGWSLGRPLPCACGRLLPAHAGMVPPRLFLCQWSVTAPRARGDGPTLTTSYEPTVRCSPRTRGWSPVHDRRQHRDILLPAHAGMVPCGRGGTGRRPSAPRARGDGPLCQSPPSLVHGCSPRTRGWSPALDHGPGDEALLPAHAGMVPRPPPSRPQAGAVPRARGDGPRRRRSTPGRRQHGGVKSPLFWYTKRPRFGHRGLSSCRSATSAWCS